MASAFYRMSAMHATMLTTMLLFIVVMVPTSATAKGSSGSSNSVARLFSELLGSPQNCTLCPDKQQNCCNGDQCCASADGGDMCCEASNLCCDGTCCDGPTESCCDGTCCIKQTTYCCPKINDRPARCCPRWMVCCAGGRDGCCTPDHLSLLTGQPPKMKDFKPTRPVKSIQPQENLPAADGPVFAMFLQVSNLHTMSIDVSTQKEAYNHPVTGFNAWGEMTRVFTYDTTRKMFYYVEANFTADVPDPQNPKRQIKMYSVDPTTGVATSYVVPTAANFPAGFAYNKAIDKIVMSSEVITNGNVTAYQFWYVDPTNGSSQLVSTIAATGDGAYAGYFHTVSPDGKTVYRLGFRDVVGETDPGLGVTDISTATATTQWIDDIPLPAQYEFYESLTLKSGNGANGTTFISLAAESGAGTYDVIEWSVGGSSKVLAKLGNAHPPKYFGPCAEAISGDTYGVFYVQKGFQFNHWILGLVNVTTGALTKVEVPALIGQTDSISGIGLP